MTPDTPTHRPTRDGQERSRRARLTTLAVLALVPAAAVTGVGATAAQDGPTVQVTDASVDPGGTATARVVLASAPDGLAGYELVLSVEGEAATIVGANYTDAFGLTTEPAVSDDGRTIRLEAADVDGNVEAGATDVTLAAVELRGESTGRAGLEVRPVQFDADGGARMNVGVEPGSVVVGEPEPTATPTPEPAATTTDEAGAIDDSASSSDVDTSTATPTNTTTSGQGGLPLAGLGVAAVALVVVGALLARRR